MPNRKRIADLDVKIQTLHTEIEALRASNASRTETDRVLSELARVKSERLRLMLRQINISAEQRLYQAMSSSGPQEPDTVPEG